MSEDASENLSSDEPPADSEQPSSDPAIDEHEEASSDSPSEPRSDADDANADEASSTPPSERPDHLTDENFLVTRWRGHDIAVSGDWTLRWLFLTPTYTLWIDGEKVESVSGPRITPSLDAVLEAPSGEAYHLKATLTSIIGYRPPCKIMIEEEVIAQGDLRVANFLNPFLVLFILIATGAMLYVGPDVVARYLP